MTKHYLGDAVYAEIFDDGLILLTTERLSDGEIEIHKIYLEPTMLARLRDLVAQAQTNQNPKT